MVGNNSKSILQTLAYADIFDYPLTRDEIWRFLISDKKTSQKSVQKTLRGQISGVISRNGYYALLNRTHIIHKRIKRGQYSKEKMHNAHKICSYISFIPTVLLVGISGGLAMKNAGKADDIDFFIIAKKGTLWLTRLFTLIILEFLKVRRKRLDTDVANKICLNMLIDETSLCISSEKQNLYSAHEVVQMIPLFAREDTYKIFLDANMWVRKFLPNALIGIMNKESRIKGRKNSSFIIRYSLFTIEWVAKKVQLWHIEQHKTEEITQDNFLAFYPFGYHNKVLAQYRKRLAQYKIV